MATVGIEAPQGAEGKEDEDLGENPSKDRGEDGD
jgi:hypothetical protein